MKSLIGNAFVYEVKNCRHFIIHASIHPGMKDLLKELIGDEPVDIRLH